ncbi:MAG TPA: OmpA family protein [Steroidobacteraceae bacterium]|nr:OmpA family protein [Steroidobacteraceae bacterium]
MRKNALIFASVAALLGACASMPQRSAQLEEARTQVQTLSAEPLAQQAAAHDLEAARASLNQADAALAQHEPPQVVDHLAYLARRHADAGQARVDEARARQDVAKAQDERNRILLESRTREARNAQANAQVAQSQAQAAQQQLQSTQQQLQDLQAKQTERGMVLTLGDVLFDTNKATLKPGADQKIDRLATFLQKNPNERLIIEGYTDSTGSEEYNEELSQRRAQAVANVLAGQGVPASRYQVVGKGQAFPVASNATPAGRQQNRRVEIVFSDQSGRFAEAPEREGAQQR